MKLLLLAYVEFEVFWIVGLTLVLTWRGILCNPHQPQYHLTWVEAFVTTWSCIAFSRPSLLTSPKLCGCQSNDSTLYSLPQYRRPSICNLVPRGSVHDHFRPPLTPTQWDSM
ncbi:hypothetical protein EDB85DRAFT_1972636 [Lactarius pseudohatsudake]|nr:hypothetical protein EDB85DRAFT_2040074 [Lactarius pseudohatsudake]KAH9027879.1 hypothetical protein EDB85DRAFT_1972636 [Lactarius pseudohatsudake]